ncbi:stage II sporulation protein AA (anti-sigma F factor antagonist) [Thermomonospora echinospora]|uniref:Anti-sigma factor antagonist n=1 Tax=Thermomonospora echinospora TaxID=1992 RepID=A0A1H5SSF8_9ACTN|nr:STAS domain-containing protein [Thermomonospora echinospora]SEF53509.1 stage II sporulation protein AA (anti-sigma F factor antagonist) [Thermomonospora echinospora]
MVSVVPHGPGDQLTITIGRREGWIVVEVSGELDLSSVDQLKSAVKAALKGVDEPRLALDLAGVEFCDSSGLTTFVHLRQDVERRAGRFVLLRPHPYVRQVLEMTGLSPEIGVRDGLSGEDPGLTELSA